MKRAPIGNKLTVIELYQLSAHIKQVVFKVESEQPLEVDTTWIGPHVKLLFPNPQAGQIVFPEFNEQHKVIWPEGQPRPPVRTYSVRHYDSEKNQLTVTFVVHAGGVASSWVQQAKVGSQIGLLKLSAKHYFADQYMVLIGDTSALPAICYTLEHLPKSAQGRALIEVQAEEDIQALIVQADMHINWIVRGDNQPSQLVEALSMIELPEQVTPLFWGGMEGDLARQVRQHLKGRFELSRESLQIVNYWRQGLAEGEFSHREE